MRYFSFFSIALLLILGDICSCTTFGFPDARYAQEVLNCYDFKTCEKLYSEGQKIYHFHSCDSKAKVNFVWQIQERSYCVDMKMYLDITQQKMDNFKK